MGKTAEQIKEERAKIRAKQRGQEIEGLEVEKRKTLARSNMILTTESSHNLNVEARLGIVTAEIVVGMNIFKDMLTGVRNIVGGRTGNVQNALKEMRETVLEELKNEAAVLGANAVVAVDLNYQEIGATGSTMLMLVASGTAVRIEE